MDNLYLSTYRSLENWIDNNPLSYDVSDIKSIQPFLWFYALSRKNKLAKYISFPAIFMAERYTNVMRRLFKVKKQIFPQGQAILARAYLADYRITSNEQTLQKALTLLAWLEKNPSVGFKYYCWGQPYKWVSRTLFPAHVPRATVTSQVANAFIDAFEITGEQKYLDIAIQASHFFIDDLNWVEDIDGHICFSYTTVDDFNIHNASMLAAAVLIRVWKHSGIEKFKTYGLKAMNFTVKHQNPDGSWFYWAPPFKIDGKIDNYHTGFILEALEIIKQNLRTEFHADDAIDKGLDFYLKNLFDDSMIPKMTHKSKYPIDIQSCAQAIMTLGELTKRKPELNHKLMQVTDWTLNNMYNPKGYFYYRIYQGGKIDQTPYMRWSESWMLRALTFVNYEKQ